MTDDDQHPVETLSDALRRGRKRLAAAGTATPGLDAEVLLRHVLGVDRTELFVRLPEPIAAEALATYDRLLEERAGDIPVAYLTGEREFMGIDLCSRPGRAGAASRDRAPGRMGRSPGSASAIESPSRSSTSGPARARSRSASPRRWHRTGEDTSSPLTSHRSPSRLPPGTALRLDSLIIAIALSRARSSPGCEVRSISCSPISRTCVPSRSRRIPRLPPNRDWRSTAARMGSISSASSLTTRHASSRPAERSAWRSTPASATMSSTWHGGVPGVRDRGAS